MLKTYTSTQDSISVGLCILELIKESIKKQPSCIAVRFDCSKCKIHIIDNGIGYTEQELLSIFAVDIQTKKLDDSNIFHRISHLSSAIMVISRAKYFPDTYVQAYLKYKSTLFKGEHRPCAGTTISLYNFNPPVWRTQKEIGSSISNIVLALSLSYSNISFLVQNEESRETILNVNRQSSSSYVLELLNSNKIIKDNSPATNSTIKKVKIFSKVSQDDNENPKALVQDKNIDNISSLSQWSNWSYYPIQRNSSCLSKFSNLNDNLPQNEPLRKNFDLLIRNSNNRNLRIQSVSSPLPLQLNTKSKNAKITVEKDDIDNRISKNILPFKQFNIFCQEMKSRYISQEDRSVIDFNDQRFSDIFKGNAKDKQVLEYRITRKTIKSLKVLRQINKEFIGAIALEDEKKVLVIIDQHAVHERIRYEFLINDYKDKETGEFRSVTLRSPLLVINIEKYLLKLASSNKKSLHKVGINIKCCVDESNCLVDAVPLCFVKKFQKGKTYQNQRLVCITKDLIVEVADSLSHNIVPPTIPITINNVIASEACHEAIKFGDPLSENECDLLIQSLQDVQAPNRCAHGRPSVIPVIDLSYSEKNRIRKKLNFSQIRQ